MAATGSSSRALGRGGGWERDEMEEDEEEDEMKGMGERDEMEEDEEEDDDDLAQGTPSRRKP